MAEMKERFAMSLGFTLHTQKIDPDTNAVMMENFVNVWGGRLERLNYDEAILLQSALDDACGDDLDAMSKKARAVCGKFGLNLIGNEPEKSGKSR